MLLLVCHSAPGETGVREWTDMALMAALFQRDPVLLLLGAGARNLFDPDTPLAELAELPVSSCRVDGSGLPKDPGQAVLDHERLDADGIRALFAEADQVVSL
jgi:hypothetical protein